MKRIILNISWIIILLLPMAAQSQQTSLNTLYHQNYYLVNPAAAGLKNCFSAYLNHRNQWVGINESPTRNALTIDGRLVGNHGLGLDVRMFQAGLLKNFNVRMTYAYHLTVAEKAKLSFGISLGFIQQSFAFSEAIVTSYEDPTLSMGNQSDVGFNSDAGLLFSTPRLKAGISIPQIFSRGLFTQVEGAANEFRLVPHFLGHLSVDLLEKSTWQITPTFLYKNAALSGHQLDVGVNGMLKNVIGAGIIYRTGYGVIGKVNLTLLDKLKLAYGYGFGGNNLTGLSNGSHEIMLGIKLCRSDEPVVDRFVEEVEEDTITEIEIVEIVPVEKDTVVIQEPDQVERIDLDSLNKAFAAADRLIVYELNSSEEILSDNQKEITKMVAEILRNHPDLGTIVIGHTCNLGGPELNQRISEQRAEDIQAELILQGVDANKIKIVAKGETDPRVTNNSEDNRSKNRRVQLMFEWR